MQHPECLAAVLVGSARLFLSHAASVTVTFSALRACKHAFIPTHFHGFSRSPVLPFLCAFEPGFSEHPLKHLWYNKQVIFPAAKSFSAKYINIDFTIKHVFDSLVLLTNIHQKHTSILENYYTYFLSIKTYIKYTMP